MAKKTEGTKTTKKTTKTAAPATPATTKTKKAKAEIIPVAVADDEKVSGITKENYAAVKARAAKVQELLTDTFNETGGLPSHKYVQSKFSMSIKAVIQHKRRWAKNNNIDLDSLPPATINLKKAVTEE